MLKINFIDNPEERLKAASAKGAIAADRGLARECEFYAPELRAAWFEAYDAQLQRQPKPWGRVCPTS